MIKKGLYKKMKWKPFKNAEKKFILKAFFELKIFKLIKIKLQRPNRTIRLQNRRFNFDLETSVRLLIQIRLSTFVSNFLLEFNFQALFPNHYTSSNSVSKFGFSKLGFSFNFDFRALFPSFYSNSNSKLDSPILIWIRSFVFKFLFEFEVWCPSSCSNSNWNSGFVFEVLIRTWVRSLISDFLSKFEFEASFPDSY